jgi:hypothetical protein
MAAPFYLFANDNEKTEGVVMNKRYIKREYPAGKVRIGASAVNKAKGAVWVDIEATAGETYYVKVVHQFIAPGVYLLGSDEGDKFIKTCKLA